VETAVFFSLCGNRKSLGWDRRVIRFVRIFLKVVIVNDGYFVDVIQL
jgi:hypothetical protein